MQSYGRKQIMFKLIMGLRACLQWTSWDTPVFPITALWWWPISCIWVRAEDKWWTSSQVRDNNETNFHVMKVTHAYTEMCNLFILYFHKATYESNLDIPSNTKVMPVAKRHAHCSEEEWAFDLTVDTYINILSPGISFKTPQHLS